MDISRGDIKQYAQKQEELGLYQDLEGQHGWMYMMEDNCKALCNMRYVKLIRYLLNI